MTRTEIGNTVRQRIDELGLTIIGLADRLGMSNQTIYSILQGRDYHMSSLEKVCKELGLGVRVERSVSTQKQTEKVYDNPCRRCGKPVGNNVFTYCDDCWDSK